MTLKKIWNTAVVLILTLFLGCSAPLFAAGKVGYINLERLVKESSLGKQATKEIEQVRNEKQVLISQKIHAINTMKMDVQSHHQTLKDTEKKSKIDELNFLIKEYKRMVADAKEDIARQDREMVAQILQKADGALKKVAKKKKFTIILKDPNAIGYLDDSVDITDDVLKVLNQ